MCGEDLMGWLIGDESDWFLDLVIDKKFDGFYLWGGEFKYEWVCVVDYGEF